MSSRPVLHIYQIPSKYYEGYSSYRTDTKSNSNTRRGGNSKRKKAKGVILVCNMSSCPELHLYQIKFKQSKGLCSYRADTKSNSNTRREITPKARKTELSFLFETRHFVLFCILPNIIKIF